MILDFANAFMSLPLAEGERKYNCTVVSDELTRTRGAISEREPQSGKCIVWRFFGFGGRPNPSLYSRAASFAARTAQALLGVPERIAQLNALARSRLQLYVDDLVITTVGYPDQVKRSFYLVLLWWLCLGIPLAWSKGKVIDASHPYTWIGVRIKMFAGESLG